MKIFDRLYGDIKFPEIILDLLNCPGLLRLKEVRMANNPFVAFPAFATASRYEHSIGVCYLAGICGDALGLNEMDKMELMIAGLYHDVGTPPFAHAMEEVLQAKFGFDHETNLKNLIIGTTGRFDGEFAQIFQGEGLKLRSVCQNGAARKLGIDLYRIADLSVGNPNDKLSPLINGNGMDLDNIDNIFRASSAMGLISYNSGEIAKQLARAFVLKEDELFYDGGHLNEIHEWQRVRDVQYSAIFDSIDDFAYQTMIKKALRLLLEDDSLVSLDESAWRLTDSSMTYEYLLKHAKSAQIMQRVVLCRPYECLGILYVEGPGITKFINRELDYIEEVASRFFIDILGVSKENKECSEEYRPVVANFFPDKRKRCLKRKTLFMG